MSASAPASWQEQSRCHPSDLATSGAVEGSPWLADHIAWSRRHNGVFKDFTTNVLNYLEAGRNVSFFSATRISRQVDVDERILGKLTFAVSLLCRDPPHPPAVRDIPIPTFGVPEAAPPMSCSSRSCCGYCREWFVSLHAGCARHKPIKP